MFLSFLKQSTGNNNVVRAILPISTSNNENIVVLGGNNIRFWDLNHAERSYIFSDPLYKACNFCFNKSNLNTSENKSNAKIVPSATSPPQYLFESNLYGSHTMASADVAFPRLATYVARQDPTDQSVIIEEIDCSSDYNHFQASHYCALDQQFVATAHHDTITDLLRVNQYCKCQIMRFRRGIKCMFLI